MTEPALFHTLEWLVFVPLVILFLGLRRLRKNWPWLAYSAIAGIYLYHLWAGGVTVLMLILIVPIAIFGLFLKRRGLY